MNRTIPDRVDVFVVGAGIAGATAAARVARDGRSVLLVERLPRADVGRKVCGNGIADEGLESASRYISAPTGAEVAWRVEGGMLVLQDGETSMRVPKAGVVLNRFVLGQRLLADAMEAGCVFADRCSCAGWSDREAKRVRLDLPDGARTEVAARVVIDASGYRAVLTRSGGPLRAETLERCDVGIGYREIVPLTSPLPEPRAVIIDLGTDEARGGYGWIFPMGERLANIGIGATLERSGGDLRKAYRAFLERHPEVRTSRPLESGAGMLPLRRPLLSMVGDGFVAVGDAGCQT
ncbi:MAG: FAD-dependent oxidoreductase, partial [Candidatus Eisenbacteria bacterium]|nr:FAD-dependent oxidoreductase [Candidatus Eisenbacteria bacterium]